MLPEKIKRLLEKYKAQGQAQYFDGAIEEQIVSFEKANHVSLPAEYKEWLMYSDGGYLFLPAGIQLYGVAHKPVIKMDDENKPNDTYIVIGSLATGDPILCETTGTKISIYNHEAGRIEPDETYPDFYSFIGDLNGILGLEG